MHQRLRWLAPVAAFAAALGLLTLALAATDRPAVTAAALPFHNVAPLLASDSGNGTGATPTAATNACGSGHASLLTFTDSAAAAIPRDPTAATIGFLATQPRPTIAADATRTAPFETTLYRLDVTLVSMSYGANHAIMLVLAGAEGGLSLRATLPDQPCTTGAPDADRGAIFGARTALRLACGEAPASGTRDLRGTATITGAGFWGTSAALGAASNGAELGPILSFTFTDPASCDPTHATPTPTPTQPPLTSIIVSTNVPQVAPGSVPGTLVTANVQTHPALAGVQCVVQYVSPPPQGSLVGAVLSDPALSPKTTGADGTATWQWHIPLDSPPGDGRFETHCGGKIAAIKVNVSP
jgi:hypothetical protein